MKVTRDDLRDRYLAMEDDQLMDVASKDLTEDARAVIDEVMVSRGISGSQVMKRAVVRTRELVAEQPSLVIVVKAWRRLNQAFLFPVLYLALVGVLELTGLLVFFQAAQFMAELAVLSFMGLVTYFQIRLFLLVVALKKNVMGWFLLWLVAPFASVIIYIVMWDAVKVVRGRAVATASENYGMPAKRG